MEWLGIRARVGRWGAPTSNPSLTPVPRLWPRNRTFRQAFRSNRCLVLADGFYEWKRAGKSKVPHRIAFKRAEHRLPLLASGARCTIPSGRPYTTFAIHLTTEANELVAQIHNRMPVILHARG